MTTSVQGETMHSFMENLHNEHPTWNAYDLAVSYKMATGTDNGLEAIKVACEVLGITLRDLHNGSY